MPGKSRPQFSGEVSELRWISATCYCPERASVLTSWPQYQTTPYQSSFPLRSTGKCGSPGWFNIWARKKSQPTLLDGLCPFLQNCFWPGQHHREAMEMQLTLTFWVQKCIWWAVFTFQEQDLDKGLSEHQKSSFLGEEKRGKGRYSIQLKRGEKPLTAYRGSVHFVVFLNTIN